MSDRLAYALIGCGEIAVQTSKGVLASEKGRVVHCMDIRGDLAEDLAARHEARATDQLDVVLADEEVQAVIVSTPHYTHSPLAVRAAEAGKHVLVEKPVACTLAETDAMIAAAEKAEVKAGVMHVQRLGFAYATARELVQGGAIGNVVAAKIHGMSDKPGSYWHGGFTGRVKDDWRTRLASAGGGYLIMNQIHNLDSMVSILDPTPQRIYAEYGTFRTPVEPEDYLSFVLRLEGGAIVSLDGSSAAVGGGSFGDHIYGACGQVVISREGLQVYVNRPWGELDVDTWNDIPAPADPPNTRSVMVDAFADAVFTDAEVPVPVRQGRRALEIVRGALLSMQRGAPVEFPVKED